MTAPAIHTAIDNGSCPVGQWLVPLARFEPLRSSFHKVASGEIDPDSAREQFDSAVELLRITVQNEMLYPSQAQHQVTYQRTLYQLMEREHLQPAAAHRLALEQQLRARAFARTGPTQRQQTPVQPQSQYQASQGYGSGSQSYQQKPFKGFKAENEVISQTDLRNAPYGHWVRPEKFKNGKYNSRKHPSYLICAPYNKRRCTRTFRACKGVHECLRCHEIGHPEDLCPQLQA